MYIVLFCLSNHLATCKKKIPMQKNGKYFLQETAVTELSDPQAVFVFLFPVEAREKEKLMC